MPIFVANKIKLMKQNKQLIVIAVVMVLAAALSRVAFYPINFSPVIAMALFGGAVIKDKKLAFALPLFAMLIADFLFEITNIAPGFWGWGQVVGYGILAVITMFGFNLKKITALKVAGFSIASSLIFFFLSNSSVWLLAGTAYPRSIEGWMACLAAGVPFLEKGLLTDLLYSGVFFGGYVLARHYMMKKQIA
jgi:hypothetical protein